MQGQEEAEICAQERKSKHTVTSPEQCVCVCVCLCVCVCVCVYNVCVCVCLCVCVCMYVYVCMYACMYAYQVVETWARGGIGSWDMPLLVEAWCDLRAL